MLLSCAMLTLGACGDDGGGGGGGTNASTGVDSDTPGTTTENPPTTTDPDTTAGPGNPTTDEPTTDDPSTGTVGGDNPLAFRFNSLNLRDPVAGIGGNCDSSNDIHVNTVNGGFNMALNSDDRAKPDGFNDLGFVLDFADLDQSDGSGGAITFANAACEASADPTNCSLLDGTAAYPTAYTVMEAGTCLMPEPGNINPMHDPPAPTTSGPCFVTDAQDVIIVAGSFSLPLADARIAAQFVGDPAGNLVSGSIQGFVSQADADATEVDVPGLPVTIPLSMLLCNDDLDAGGWFMHLEFTAIEANWEG